MSHHLLIVNSTTAYVTVCPYERTTTFDNGESVYTGKTTSTVYSTYTSTICTNCIAPTPAESTPVPTSPAKIHEVITTVM